jgi:hypothetical protein
MSKPLLAFMQNMWLLPRSREFFLRRFQLALQSGGEDAAENYRVDFIKRVLFFRCLTGRRIMKAFEGDVQG